MESLSKQLQEINLTADVAIFCIRNVSERLTEMRSNEEFHRILQHTKNIPEIQQLQESVARKRQIPNRLSNSVITEKLHLGGATSESEEVSPEQKLRHSYFEAIDAIRTSLDERFEQVVTGLC